MRTAKKINSIQKFCFKKINSRQKYCFKNKFDKNIVSIFLLPPSDDVLIKRLKARTNISDIAVKNRIAAIKGELVYSDVATVKFEPIDGDIDGSFEKFDELANKYIFNNI